MSVAVASATARNLLRSLQGQKDELAGARHDLGDYIDRKKLHVSRSAEAQQADQAEGLLDEAIYHLGELVEALEGLQCV